MNKPKVLQVIDRLEVGGAEKVFLDLTHLLLNEGVQVDILLVSGKGPLHNRVDTRANTYFLNRKWKFNPLKMFECASVCSKYNIVHVHLRHSYAYVRLAQVISFKKYKIIFHDHSGNTQLSQAIPFNLKGLFKPKYYVGVSEKLARWAVNGLGIKSENVFCLRNTIIPCAQDVTIKPLGDMVMISNIRPVKNIELAIALADKLKRNLTIYGNVHTSKYSKDILKQIETSSFVTLIRGEAFVQRFLKNYSLALHTSFSETGPLVLVEYLSKGLPFLAHSAGEVADVLKNEIPECFIDSLDITEWEERVSYLESASPSVEKLNGLFYKYFGSQQYVEKCLDIYNHVLD